MSELLSAEQHQQVRTWLLERVPDDGNAVGNKSLREVLAQQANRAGFWLSEADYWLVRDRLIDEGLLYKGGGRGGSVYRFNGGQPSLLVESDEDSADSDSAWEQVPSSTIDIPPALENLRNRLLDLSARNRLLNFSHTRGKRFVRVIDELPDQLFDTLTSDKGMRFEPVPEPSEPELIAEGYLKRDVQTGVISEARKLPNAEVWARRIGLATEHELPPAHAAAGGKHQDHSIQTLYYPPELESRLQVLYTQSRSALEETGANILYLALGFLEWDESVAGKNSTRLAPLMLIPVRLERGELNRETATYEYRLQYNGEDILTNLSLREKLKRDFNIALPAIRDEMRPEAYFKAVSDTVLRAKPGWHVRRYASLGLFEFGKLMMYLDLDPARWKDHALLYHTLVQRLTGASGVETAKDAAATGFCEEYPIDELAGVHQHYPLIDDADSSQHSALVDAIDGVNLVIEGPPGTGKSQTITNMIAAAMARGKKVLFVAEKRAALEVVKSRLTRAGLGDFCLELHSHKSQKQAVLASIGQRLHKRGQFRSPRTLESLIQHYEQHKQQLNRYVAALHAPFGQTGLTVHQVLMQATRLREALPLEPELFHPSHDQAIDREHLEEQARFYASYYAKTSLEGVQQGKLETHPWFGVQRTQLAGQERTALLDSLHTTRTALDNLATAQDQAAQRLDMALLAQLDVLELATWAERLAGLPEVHGDEDWQLLPKLSPETCEALCVWLEEVDRLIAERERLAQALVPEAVKDKAQLAGLAQACAKLRQHSDNEHLSLNLVLDAIQNTRTQLEFAPKVLELLSRIREQAPATNQQHTLIANSSGLEHLATLLQLAQALPRDLTPLRQRLFDEGTLDTLLPELEQDISELLNQQTRTGQTFSLERLPDAQRLEDLGRILADRSLLRWFKGTWRLARNELLQLARPGVGFHDACGTLAAAAAFQHNLRAFQAKYPAKLGALFTGLETPVASLKAVRDWYRQVRETCGRGFGAKTWLAEWLLHAAPGTLDSVRDEAHAILPYLALVEQQREALEELFNFDKHDLRSLDLLGPEGVFPRLVKEIGGALDTLLSAIRITAPTLGDLMRILKEAEACQLQASHLQQNELLLDCLDGAPLPCIDDTSQARELLSSWRHTAAMLQPVRALPAPEALLERLIGQGPREGEALLTLWREMGQHLQQAIASWQAQWADFLSHAEVDETAWWSSLAQHTIPQRSQRLAQAAERPDLLEHWFEYRRLRNRLLELGFASVVDAIERQQLDPALSSEACLLGLLDRWAKSILTETPELGQFSGKEQDVIRSRFAEIDHELKSLQRAQIAWSIDQNKVAPGINSGRVKERSELALLEHEASKQRRHEPIRNLILRAPMALQALMPCFMMSPMAVAQYLPAGHLEFDLIVMDEASQLRPEEALGSIARGKQVIVVGDPKQLPPTNFFARQGGDDNAEEDEYSIAEDAESILDAAMPLFKLRRLRWHYRSRHESLIAFSNSHFYENDLVIYPSPHRESHEFGVKFVTVPRGRFVEQRNIEEAELLVKAIEHHLLHSPHESLGVVAMNIKQADQIERMLEQRAKEHPVLQHALEKNQSLDEPLFVKNLENVQGDERDVIFISCTYGPMEVGGKVLQRFGPINGADGWRRLNVLFTRSKKRMHVFASFGANDVTITGSSSRGVQALRNFLQYAESGRMTHLQESGRAAGSDFEIAVQDALARHGFECEPQVGVAGFFIDLAVRDPGQPGRYLMGIECDGAAYHSAKSARDRDRLRQSILEQLGWCIRRIWSVDWYRNARPQLDPIIRELRSLQSVPVHEDAESILAEDEAQAIHLAALETTEHIEQVAPKMRGETLREKLEWFDQEIIRQQCSDTDEAHRLLRPAMIEALLEFKPATRWEFLDMIPGYLRSGTDANEGRFLDDVLTLICES